MRTSRTMYILGVALAAAAVNTDVSASVYGGSVVSDSEGRFQDSFPRGVSHESLLAQAHKQPKGLLRPLRFYIMPFMEWAVEHKVAFDSVEDAVHGLKNFAVSDDRIHTHNIEEVGFSLGHNAYSHMSWEEFRNHFSIGKGMMERSKFIPDFEKKPRREAVHGRQLRSRDDLPDEVDWVTKGAVTDVKNQGSCGSCWAFSTTGSMEGAHYIKTKTLVSFSEQELVDCDTYDMGCNGGLMDYSFHWIQQNGGICSEEDYPYEGQVGSCRKSECTNVSGTDVDKWVDVDTDDEEALKSAVVQQPVSIAIEADQMSFQLYSGGVLTAYCGTDLDHGVLLVGYGTTDDGVDYWKVKNSWGADWGMDGYVLLERGSSQDGGECGILEQPSYPVLA